MMRMAAIPQLKGLEMYKVPYITLVKFRDDIYPRRGDTQESYDAYHARVMARIEERQMRNLRNQFRYAAGLIYCPENYNGATCDALCGGHR